MVKAWRKEAWDHTATIIYMLAVVHSKPEDRRRLSVEQFNPYRCDDVAAVRGTPYTVDVFRRGYEQWKERQQRENIIRTE